MTLCASFVLAISKSQRNFLVELHLKCCAVSMAAPEVGGFLCDVSACFLSSTDTAVPPCTWVIGDYVISLY